MILRFFFVEHTRKNLIAGHIIKILQTIRQWIYVCCMNVLNLKKENDKPIVIKWHSKIYFQCHNDC